jgi:hypothetical protein
MLRQLLVGIAVSVCNIAIHAVVMATVVEISSRIARAHHTAQQSVRLTIVMIATVSVATVPVLMAAHLSEVMVWALAYVIVDAAPAGADPRIFRFRELHDARLRRRHSGGALATARANNGDERRAHVWLVDRRHIRGAAENCEARRLRRSLAQSSNKQA